MDPLPGNWGLYQWFNEHGVEMIHPDDLEEMQRLVPNGKVFECIASDGRYVTLRYNDRCFRVDPRLFKTVPHPAKSFGDIVYFRKRGKLTFGTICDIQWHFQKQEPFYYVCVDGKRLRKQYWLQDFEDGVEKNGSAGACSAE